MARRPNQTRELVRLSPLQFSLSVSIVVVLLGGAGLAGYFYGIKQANRTSAQTQTNSSGVAGRQADSKPVQAGTDASVTFYSALTKPRTDVPVPKSSLQPERKKVPADPELPSTSVKTAETGNPAPRSGSVMLQVASYKDQIPARKLLQELSSEGYAGTVVQADLGERGIWFRVRIGPYVAGDAQGVLDKLRDEKKLKGYIVR